MEEIRRKIGQRLIEKGKSQSWLSQALGKNRAYIFQYIEHGSPRDLSYQDKLTVAKLLEMELRDLGIAETSNVVPITGTLREDAEAYVPSASSFLAVSPHLAYFVMRTDALDELQPDPIRSGDLVVFNLNDTHPAPGKVVVAQLYDKRDLTKSHGTIIRVYMAPNKLVTNSSGDNEIIRMDDPHLPWEPVIKGVMISVVREVN